MLNSNINNKLFVIYRNFVNSTDLEYFIAFKNMDVQDLTNFLHLREHYERYNMKLDKIVIQDELDPHILIILKNIIPVIDEENLRVLFKYDYFLIKFNN